YYPQPVALSDADEARLEAVSAEYDALIEGYSAYDEMPEDVAAQAEALNDEVDALAEKRSAFDADLIARRGAFVTPTNSREVQIVRGYVRAEDEPKAEPEPEDEEGREPVEDDEQTEDAGDEVEAEDSDPGKPISDSLIRDLTAHRTLGLRIAVDERTGMALV